MVWFKKCPWCTVFLALMSVLAILALYGCGGGGGEVGGWWPPTGGEQPGEGEEQPPPAGTRTITGRVVVAGTGQPVAQAVVEVEGQPNIRTTTNAQGNYVLQGAPTGRFTLVVTDRAGNTERVIIEPGQTTADIALRITTGGGGTSMPPPPPVFPT
ncbi:MAG TPA: carboxypeptidase-like regulatory domain-containing protein [Armatimonadetes bacterium]|nr:carboxypeptidase-like regulatory domain-containing protein [Armatimonadota bacterium]